MPRSFDWIFVRIVAVVQLLATLASVLLMGAAMAAYPGGTFHDPSRVGHHFWFNFMCDLLRDQGLNGRPNPRGAALSLWGMLMLAVAIVCYFIIAPGRMVHVPRAAVAVAILGPVASAGLVAVALLPSDRFPRWHTVALVTAAMPGLMACGLAIFAGMAEPASPMWFRLLGGSVFLSLTGTFILYVWHTFFGGGFLRALPALQRVAILLALIWMSATARAVLSAV